jgi:hypothetical protein
MRHVLHLSSNQADRYPLGKFRTDDIIFDITSGELTAYPDQTMMMHVESASIPASCYPVTPSTNNFKFTDSNGVLADTSFNIPVGAYASGEALVAAMNEAVTAGGKTGIAFSFSTLTYKISCTRTTVTPWSFRPSTSASVIGCGHLDLALPSGVATEFPGVIDLAGPKKYLITSQDIEMRTRDSVGRNVNILAAVPVDKPFGQLVSWQNQTGVMMPTNRKALSEIRLTLLDEDQHPVNLNGLEWAVSIVVEIY